MSRPRLVASAALAALLLAYYFVYPHLPDLRLAWETVVLCLLFPAVFGLVWLLLPLQRSRGLLPLALALGTVAALAEVGDLEVLANFTKLAAVTAFAWWFLGFFEQLAWVVIVASLIPWIDAYSVWRGPTGDIVENHPDVFSILSFAFPLPGERNAAQLGLPDFLFFALFLAAAVRFRLRPGWTFAGMVLALDATITLTIWTSLAGLPALPAISLGFLLPNADLLWARFRAAR